MPPKCVNDEMISLLENNSLPVSESNAYRIACVELLTRSAVPSEFPAESACPTSSPLEIAKTTPLAIIGGSGTFRSREFHAGVNAGEPSFASTRNAITLPCGVAPYEIGNGGAAL